jgi:hypothetical protein
VYSLQGGVLSFLSSHPKLQKAHSPHNQIDVFLAYHSFESEFDKKYFARFSPLNSALYLTKNYIWVGILLEDSLYYNTNSRSQRENYLREGLEQRAQLAFALWGSSELNELPISRNYQRYVHYQKEDNVLWRRSFYREIPNFDQER